MISRQLQHGRAQRAIPAGDPSALTPHGMCYKCSLLNITAALPLFVPCVWEPNECGFRSISNKRPCIDSQGHTLPCFIIV